MSPDESTKTPRDEKTAAEWRASEYVPFRVLQEDALQTGDALGKALEAADLGLYDDRIRHRHWRRSGGDGAERDGATGR